MTTPSRSPSDRARFCGVSNRMSTLSPLQRAAAAARCDPHRRAVVAIDIDDEAAAGHPR